MNILPSEKLERVLVGQSLLRMVGSGFRSGASACGVAGVMVAVLLVIDMYLQGSNAFDASLTGIWALAGVGGLVALVVGTAGTLAGGLMGAVAGILNGVLAEVVAWYGIKSLKNSGVCERMSQGMSTGVKLGLVMVAFGVSFLAFRGSGLMEFHSGKILISPYLLLPPLPFLSMVGGGLMGLFRGISLPGA